MYFLKCALLSPPADFERAAWHAGEHLSWCVLGFPPLSSSSAAHMKQNWRGKLKSKTHVFQSARCQIFPPAPTLLKGGTGHVDSAASSWMVKINKCKTKKKERNGIQLDWAALMLQGHMHEASSLYLHFSYFGLLLRQSCSVVAQQRCSSTAAWENEGSLPANQQVARTAYKTPVAQRET